MRYTLLMVSLLLFSSCRTAKPENNLVEAPTTSECNKGFLYNSCEETAPTYYPLNMPLKGMILSPFGWRGRRMHEGIDIRGYKGKPIQVATKGVVEFTGNKKGYGKTVIVNHGTIKTLYAHMSKILVKPGQKLEENALIGKVGRTGNAKGPHLHFEVREKNNTPLNPLDFLKKDELLASGNMSL